MPKQCTSDIRRFVQQWWVAFHDLSGEVVRWKYSFHWRMERSQITLDLDRFYPSESFGELHYCTVLPPFQTPGPRSFIWTTVLSRPLSCATVKSKAGDGDTLRFGVAKWPQESVRCRKPCASWRINMNQLINYLSARAGFRRKEFNGINGYEKSIKRHSSKTLAMQPFRNSVYLSRSLLLFFDTAACDAAMLYLAHIRSIHLNPSWWSATGRNESSTQWLCDKVVQVNYTQNLGTPGWRRGGSKVNVVKVQNWGLEDLNYCMN